MVRFAVFDSELSIHGAALLSVCSAAKITVRAGECILFASFGTFDKTVELKASLSQPDWECKGSWPVTASSGQLGPRCLLKGECTLCRPS
jgi:hypothetical protein